MFKKATRKKMFRAKGRKGTTTKKYKRKAGPSLRAIAAKVNKLSKTIETKSGVIQVTDGTEYGHNAINMVNNNFLGTVSGIEDQENSRGSRVGDQINLVGVTFAMMLELNERYSDVTFRLMVIRSAKGDTPTTATLWKGASGNKMLDTYNTERFTVLFTKYVKMTAPNMGNTPTGLQVVGSGFQTGTPVISRATRIVKFFVPNKKVTRSGILQYENNSQQVKFFDHHFMIYAYSNYNTSDTLGFNVGRMNDCNIKMHYKDA